MIKNLRERFVPVAVDQHVHRRLQNDEGQLFASVLKQAGRNLGGRSQGVYIFDPAGKLLSFSNTASAAHVRKLMTKALTNYQAAEDSTAPAAKISKSPQFGTPPEGTLIALVNCKVLGGYEDIKERHTDIHAASLGEDHLWIRSDEAKALAAGTLPDSLTSRLLRFHVVDNTRGEPPFWRAAEIKEAKLSLAEGELSGTIKILSTDGSRGYEAEVRGRVESKNGELIRFDLVTMGNYHGHGRYTRGAPPGKFPFAVAVRLIEPKHAADRVVPGGGRGNVKGYLR